MTPHEQRLRVFIGAFFIGFLGCVPFIAAVSPAFAQTARAGVDFTPLAMNAIDVIAAGAVVVAGFVAKAAIGFFHAKTGVHNAQIEALLLEKWNNGVQNAINYATTVAKATVADPNHKNITNVEFNGLFVNTVVGYMVQHYADSIRRWKLDENMIASIVRSRIAPYLANPVPNSASLQTVDNVAMLAPADPVPVRP